MSGATDRDPTSLAEAVAARLRARGERMTAQRRAVLEAMATTRGHLSAEEVYAAVAGGASGIHPASVYRTLEALSDLGVVQHIHLGHGATAYHLVAETQAHPHAQCRICGSVVDLPVGLLDEVARAVADQHGFRLDAAHAALSGTCARCQRENS
ncbi:MAG: Fur family transcriptional regulator [Dermatophilaceae bacterium]